MVLHSAQYKRQSNDDASYEDVFDTTIHTEGNNRMPIHNAPAGRPHSSSILNSNSMSLSGSSLSSEAAHLPPLGGASGNNDDAVSTGSDRLCNAPDGRVRFVNSTIRYHIADTGLW